MTIRRPQTQDHLTVPTIQDSARAINSPALDGVAPRDTTPLKKDAQGNDVPQDRPNIKNDSTR